MNTCVTCKFFKRCSDGAGFCTNKKLAALRAHNIGLPLDFGCLWHTNKSVLARKFNSD